MKRKKCCGFLSDQSSMEWVQNGRSWGVLFYIRTCPGHRLFQTTLEFLVSFVATNQSKQVTILLCPQMCLLQSLFSSVHLQHHSGRAPPKMQFWSPFLLARILHNRRQSPHFGSGGLFDLFLVGFSKLICYNVLLKLYSEPGPVLSVKWVTSCLDHSSLPSGWAILTPSFYLPFAWLTPSPPLRFHFWVIFSLKLSLITSLLLSVPPSPERVKRGRGFGQALPGALCQSVLYY